MLPDDLERTPLAQSEFHTKAASLGEEELLGEFGLLDTMFADLSDEPIEAACDLENPDVCESCQ
jgi:hypothetical protein